MKAAHLKLGVVAMLDWENAVAVLPREIQFAFRIKYSYLVKFDV